MMIMVMVGWLVVGDNKQIKNKVNTENDKEEGKKNPIKQTKLPCLWFI